MTTRSGWWVVLCLLVALGASPAAEAPLASPDLVLGETDGLIVGEAEHYFRQSLDEVRRWYLTTADRIPDIHPDGDPNHSETASGGAYLEALPDTRRGDRDKLINGENFSDQPGKMAVLDYKIQVTTPGRYYVWARLFSTNSEDNGLHVGLDGQWPESGRRMQWMAKNTWAWDSKQRTNEVHTGVPFRLYLDIDQPGEHILSFAMREDGAEFDKWLLTREKYDRIEGPGPDPVAVKGELPRPFASNDRLGETVFVKPGQAVAAAPVPRQPDGPGTVTVSGELKAWHKVILTLDGPFAAESDQPSPFLDYNLTVTFRHADGLTYTVPGYFAADGDAANTGASAGTKWRAHLSPDLPGEWSYTVQFRRGTDAAVVGGGEPVVGDGQTGRFAIGPTDKSGRDFRGQGRLQYVGDRYPRFAGTGEIFLKQGADAPENLLAYADFDGDFKTDGQKDNLIKTWNAHVADWRPGDPTWAGGKGKGLIGALNYLAGKGLNVFSFLTLNIDGDDRNVFPYVSYRDYERFDVSRLDQWEIVFEHAQRLGLFCHFKTQETENEMLLDDGDVGRLRSLYYRELVARFGHHLALNWNLGEENGALGERNQSTAQRIAMTEWFRDHDPYRHLLVIHNPRWPDDLLGDVSALTGFSMQTGRADFAEVHGLVVQWVQRSAAAGRPWAIAVDEPGDAEHALLPDAEDPEHRDARVNALWGTLLGGGWGNEWYFGYAHPHSDLTCQDWRSRDKWWDQCRIALDFCREQALPLPEMVNQNALIGNPKNQAGRYCFAKAGELYLVYLGAGGTIDLDLTDAPGTFTLGWFNPRTGGALHPGGSVEGGTKVTLGPPPTEPEQDWLAVVRRR